MPEGVVIVSLQMYDWPEAATANDAFWARARQALAADGIAAPDRLTRCPDLASCWRDPALLLGQTCGYPLVLGLAGAAQVVARPVHAAEGCGPGGTYRSALVARRAAAGTPLEGFRGARVAVNGWDSQSGFNTLAAMLDGLEASGEPFFGSARVTGAHRASALAVAGGEADLAAIDCVSWAMFAAAEPEAHARLAVVGWTGEAPSLPYITAPAHADLVPALRAALAEAAASGPRHLALPVAVVAAARADYAPIAAMAARAARVAFAPGRPRHGSAH